jgi:hypothetical protein
MSSLTNNATDPLSPLTDIVRIQELALDEGFERVWGEQHDESTYRKRILPKTLEFQKLISGTRIYQVINNELHARGYGYLRFTIEKFLIELNIRLFEYAIHSTIYLDGPFAGLHTNFTAFSTASQFPLVFQYEKEERWKSGLPLTAFLNEQQIEERIRRKQLISSIAAEDSTKQNIEDIWKNL